MDALTGFNRAMAYLEEHLTDHIDSLAPWRIAGCSEYHFRRMFSFLTGMSLGDYLRRRRLAVAALLLERGESVTHVALAMGYDSPDAFSKAFAAMHGTPPSRVKKGGAHLAAFPSLTFRLTVQGGSTMKYRIEHKSAFAIAGVKKRITLVFQGVNHQLDSLWQSLTPEDIAELKSLSDTEPGGILCVSVNFSERTAQGSSLDQYLGVATTKDVPKRWQTLPVPPCDWAVFSVVGPFPDTVQKTWGDIYAQWLPSSGYELAPGPEMLWNEGPHMEKPDYRSEIWIPVRQIETEA